MYSYCQPASISECPSSLGYQPHHGCIFDNNLSTGSRKSEIREKVLTTLANIGKCRDEMTRQWYLRRVFYLQQHDKHFCDAPTTWCSDAIKRRVGELSSVLVQYEWPSVYLRRVQPISMMASRWILSYSVLGKAKISWDANKQKITMFSFCCLCIREMASVEVSQHAMASSFASLWWPRCVKVCGGVEVFIRWQGVAICICI